MAEPASSTVGVAIAIPMVSLTGSFFGVQYDALLWGFFGGVICLSYQEAKAPLKIAILLASSALVAGIGAPICAALAMNAVKALVDLGDALRLACAAGLGLGAQTAIPAGLKKMAGLIEGAKT